MSAQPQTLKPPADLTLTNAVEQQPRGAEILIEALVHEGVDSIFGYPGGAVLHIYDELWRGRGRLTHHPVRARQRAGDKRGGDGAAAGRVGGGLVAPWGGAAISRAGDGTSAHDTT